MFHFVLYGLKLTSDDISNANINPSEQSVYRLLCLDYLNYFLPLDNSASMVLPQLSFNVLSTITIPNQKQCIIPRYVKNNIIIIKSGIAQIQFIM